jgi:hypothetical protein
MGTHYMKTTITFEAETFDEHEVIYDALFASEYKAALQDIKQAFKRKYEYEKEQITTWEEVSDTFYKVLRERGIKL